MKTSVDLVIPNATAVEVFGHVETLDRYPPWMRLVHAVEPIEPDEGRAAWWVEIRARVGPFARSKRLRMVRTIHEPGHRVRFERVQPDERDHANWILGAVVEDTVAPLGASPSGGGTAGDGAPAALVRMDLEYTGSLWTGSALNRILADEIRRGSEALAGVVSSEPKR